MTQTDSMTALFTKNIPNPPWELIFLFCSFLPLSHNNGIVHILYLSYLPPQTYTHVRARTHTHKKHKHMQCTSATRTPSTLFIHTDYTHPFLQTARAACLSHRKSKCAFSLEKKRRRWRARAPRPPGAIHHRSVTHSHQGMKWHSGPALSECRRARGKDCV